MKNTRKWEIYFTPASHFDFGWCASPAECLAYGDKIIQKAIEAIDEYPDYRFTIEYSAFLSHFLERYPESHKKVKNLIQKGQLEVCGTWIGAMEQILDGEMLIREIVWAKQWAKETLDIDLETVQHTDLPGHAIQTPQILSKCGVKYIAYSRFHPPTPLHLWEAKDGSQVVACCHWVNYGWGYELFVKGPDNKQELRKRLYTGLNNAEKVWPKGISSILMGGESDLQMPSSGIVKKVELWNKENSNAQIKITTPTPFFKSISTDKLPVYCGEMPYAFYALPAASIETYQTARRAENLLASAEKLSSLRDRLGLGSYPFQEIENAWRTLAFPHDHNLGGRHGEENDRQRFQHALASQKNAEAVIQEAILMTTTHINYRQKTLNSVVVFNSLSWKRNEVADTYLEFPITNIKELAITDSSGKRIPAQITNIHEKFNTSRISFSFLAKDIPSLGYKTFYVKPSIKRTVEKKNIFQKFENKWFKLEVKNGWITQFLWKKKNIEMLESKKYHFNEVFLLEYPLDDTEDHVCQGKFDCKEYRASENPAKLVAYDSGNLFDTLTFSSKIFDSPIEQKIRIYHHLPVVDCFITIDWEGKPNTQVRVAYPFNIPKGIITYESPYGSVNYDQEEIPNTYRGTGGRTLQKWIDISNDKYGVLVATQTGAHSIADNVICPILIRSAVSCGTCHYWFEQKGKHQFTFRMIPHSGKWKDDGVFHYGWEWNNPLIIESMNPIAPIAPIRNHTFLPEEAEFCSVSRDNVAITTIKKDYKQNKDIFIMRIVEFCGKNEPVDIRFKFPIEEAVETDLLERKIGKVSFEKNRIIFVPQKYGIHTLAIKFKKFRDS